MSMLPPAGRCPVRATRRRHPRAAGQGIVEFALCCPIMLFALLGLFEYDMYHLDGYRTQGAAIAACDAASEAQTGADASALAAAAAASAGTASGLRSATLLGVSLPPGPVAPGSVYTCTVQGIHPILSSTFASQIGWTFPITARAAGAISGRNPA